MQRLVTLVALAAVTAAFARPAMADNQQVADEIARSLRDSGKLSNYRIEVQYREGTARLKGRVASQAQMNTALRLALQTPRVTRVVNELAVSSSPKRPRIQSPSVRPKVLRPRVSTKSPAPRPGRKHRASAIDWLKRVIGSRESQRQAARGSPQASRRELGRAQRVPSSFTPAPVRQAAAAQVDAPAIPAHGPTQRFTARPIPIAYTEAAAEEIGGPMPAYVVTGGGGPAPARYDQPHLPNYSWPSYAAYPNYAALTYPRQYSPTAWPYIGPFYPYPQVPLGWRKVTLEWDDGWWMLDFRDSPSCCGW